MNAGALLPTGSNELHKDTRPRCQHTLTNASPINLQLDDPCYVPVEWNWEPLGRTKQSEMLADDTIVPGELRVARELWLLRGNWLCRGIRNNECYFSNRSDHVTLQNINFSEFFGDEPS